jgi:cell division protein ZapA (FtsZ GTPase activity inhibitor)
VRVRIGGKEYGVVTDADEAWLQGVAIRVDEAMAIVRDRTETVDSLDVAVLTALNLARELVLLKEQGAASGDPIESRVDARRLREILQLAEDAIRSPSPAI